MVFGPAFWASTAASIFSASILAAFALARRGIKRTLIEPLDELRKLLESERAKRRKFQRKIVRRMTHYEQRAAEERRLQIRERERVSV
jgi:hypothetical protein